MRVIRRPLFECDSLKIGLFEARPVSDACGEVERQDLNAVVLPFSGLFSKHEAPRRHVTGTPSHAVYFRPDTPYRISFPGSVGDRAITLRFGDELAPEQIGKPTSLASHGLLPARAMMLRNLLWARLQRSEADEFEAEALGLDLLGMALGSLEAGKSTGGFSAQARRTRAVERVKEAVTLAPSAKWTVKKLAHVANLSPFHLCHVFRNVVGTSLYDYVLRERLAQALDAVLDGGDDLTVIALDAGFASHSHFTSRFKNFFGCTPATLRRVATTARIVELRKIVTAQPGGPG